MRTRPPAVLSTLAIAVALALGGAAPHALAERAGAPAAEQDGVQVGRTSRAVALASAEKVEREAATQFAQLKRDAQQQRALAPADHPQLKRLQAIADRIIPFAPRFNERAKDWKWEVILIGSKQLNAFCMPGGKIAFFTGIISQLNLTDDEIAMIMGHEIAHALREHGRERIGKQRLAQGLSIGASVLSSLLGYGDIGGRVADAGAQLTLLKFSREDETEADLVGLDIAARAGYDPRAALVLWEKMAAASKGAPPQWLSTHPSNETRSAEIRKHLKETLPLYARATQQDIAALPPYAGQHWR